MAKQVSQAPGNLWNTAENFGQDIGKGFSGAMNFWKDFGQFGKNAPPMPDYTGAVEKQTQANRPNINTPYGSQSWTQDDKGNWTLNATASPEYQRIIDAMRGQTESAWGTPLATGDEARKAASDALYTQQTARLNPMYDTQRQQLESDLANQGLDPGSAAYQQQMNNFGRSRNDAYQNALNTSIAGGTQAAQQQMGMDLMSRNAPLQALQQLGGFTSQTPGFMPSGNYLGAAQAAGDYGLGTYGINQQAGSDRMSGLFDMYGSLPSLFASLFGG